MLCGVEGKKWGRAERDFVSWDHIWYDHEGEGRDTGQMRPRDIRDLDLLTLLFAKSGLESSRTARDVGCRIAVDGRAAARPSESGRPWNVCGYKQG